jgi:hypothetical protein
LALLLLSGAAAAEPLAIHNGRLFISAKIAGVPTQALLDSGAEVTLVDPVFAARAKLAEGQKLKMKGSGGEAAARLVPGVTVEALGATLHPEAIAVTDLREISTRLLKHPTRAVIGREIFDAARLRIDILAGNIDVVGRDETPPGERLALTSHAGIESIPVVVNGMDADAEFDLGNGSDVMISRAMVRKLDLEIVGKTSGGGIGGEIQRDTVVLKTLTVAGRTFANVAASVDDQPNANDLNVGTAILKAFLITTDFSRRAVWLASQGNN